MTPARQGSHVPAGRSEDGSVTQLHAPWDRRSDGMSAAEAADHPSARRDASCGPTSGPVPMFAGMPLGEIAERSGLKRIDVLAWRDFDDPEAGGSELTASSPSGPRPVWTWP